MEKKAAIYHFTDGSNKRPIVYLKELERIKLFASNIGYSNADLYVDKSLRQCDHVKLEELMHNIDYYNALLLKDFYHLRLNTGAAMAELVKLSHRKIEIHTIEDGDFLFTTPPLDTALNVAIYYCGLEVIGHSIELQYQIMDLFVKEKTKWKVIDRYADIAGNRVDGSQKKIQKLIENKHKYDLILVQSFGSLHWRTSKFCKLRHEIQRDIYSMHEDVYLKYESVKENIK